MKTIHFAAQSNDKNAGWFDLTFDYISPLIGRMRRYLTPDTVLIGSWLGFYGILNTQTAARHAIVAVLTDRRLKYSHE